MGEEVAKAITDNSFDFGKMQTTVRPEEPPVFGGVSKGEHPIATQSRSAVRKLGKAKNIQENVL